jgi:hypothetical protein
MIPNHADFLEAVRRHKLVRIAFYSLPDNGTVDRECAPLDYAPAPGGSDPANRYWVWDPAGTAGPNPLRLLPDQIVSLAMLGKDFDPADFRTGTALQNTPSAQNPPPAESAQPAAAAPAPA